MRIFTGNFGMTETVLFTNDQGVAINISGATTKSIVFTKPDGSEVTKSATFTTDGADGKIYYNVDSALYDSAGQWQIRGQVSATSFAYTSESASFFVEVAP